MSKITRDGVWLSQMWRLQTAQGRSSCGVKPSGETIFIQFGLRLRLLDNLLPNKQRKKKCMLMDPSASLWCGVFFLLIFFLNEICGFYVCSMSGLILGIIFIKNK